MYCAKHAPSNMPANTATTSGLKVLFFGDIVGRDARKLVTSVVAEQKESFGPDIIIGNVENLAHGKGITRETIDEMFAAGFDVLTSGNHVFDRAGAEELLNDTSRALIRPINYPRGVAGRGFCYVTIGARKVLVANAIGRAYFRENFDDPFRAMDHLLTSTAHESLAAIILDWHADATSEERAMGFYLDGRVSAVLGTHSHIPTADAQILPGGTAYISDVGMVGAAHSMLGAKKEPMIHRMLTQLPSPYEIAEDLEMELHFVQLVIDPSTRRAISIKHFREIRPTL